MNRIGPGFGDWLKIARTERAFTVRGLATSARISAGTLSPIESRRYAKPDGAVIMALASALRVPVLAPAIIAGYMDQDIMDSVLDAPWEWLGRIVSSARKDWWAQSGGLYLASVRSTHGTSLHTAASSWADQWKVPVRDDEWAAMESTGRLPEAWVTSSVMSWISQCPGSWLWGLLCSAAQTYDVETDLVGFAFIMGRVGQKKSASWDAKADFLDLDKMFRAARNKSSSPDSDWIQQFHELVREHPDWTVPSLDPEPVEPPHQLHMSEAEVALLQNFRALSEEQKSAVFRIISDLPKRR